MIIPTYDLCLIPKILKFRAVRLDGAPFGASREIGHKILFFTSLLTRFARSIDANDGKEI